MIYVLIALIFFILFGIYSVYTYFDIPQRIRARTKFKVTAEPVDIQCEILNKTTEWEDGSPTCYLLFMIDTFRFTPSVSQEEYERYQVGDTLLISGDRTIVTAVEPDHWDHEPLTQILEFQFADIDTYYTNRCDKDRLVEEAKTKYLHAQISRERYHKCSYQIRISLLGFGLCLAFLITLLVL